ncbi:MAG: PP2C family serine/threonine-protein phosphatase [Vicinamibacterales bacterium]
MPVVSASLTDQGLRRPANEDSCVSRPGLGLYVVCDGMGGHAAGEVASRVAADTIEAFVQQTEGVGSAFTWPFRYQPEWGVDGNRLACALLLANREIAQRVVDEPELRGMATTAVCLLLGVPGTLQAVFAHVGDSRAYLWRDGVLDQVTRDHSWVEEQVALGVLDEQEARQHPWRNLVTRALAGADQPRVEISPISLEPGDRVLLCSDGLTSPLTNAAIAGIIASAPMGSPDALCQALVDAANAAGGPDNITVIVVEVT